jgi:hypothetical protein
MVSCDVFQFAIDRWRARSVPLQPPASETEIASVFRALNHPVSRDIYRLYSLTRGFADYEFDKLWSLWSLDRILEENKDRKSEFLWFADYLISSHMYAFHYLNADTSAVYIDHSSSAHAPVIIAESVAEFLEKYIRNPDEVEAFDLDAT